MHHRVPLDPSADAPRAINILVEQLEADRVHMLALKTAIETLRERTEAQSKLIESQDQRLNEQAAVNLKAFQEFAELRGDFTQHKVHAETSHQHLIQALNGPDMTEMISTSIEIKMEQVNEDMKKVMGAVEEQERRTVEMATYLEGLAGDRPTEGRFIISKFEQYDAKLLDLTEGVSNVHTAGVMNATAEQADIDEVKSKVAVLAGAYEALRTNGNVATFSDLQGRLAAVERAVQGATSVPVAAASPVQVGGGPQQTQLPPGMAAGPPPAATSEQISGDNYPCHCIHLHMLDKRVTKMEEEQLAKRITALEMKPSHGRAPFLPGASMMGAGGSIAP